MNRPSKEFLDHLKLERNYSSKTVDSYAEDIEKFFRFLNNEGILFDKVDVHIIRNFLTIELSNGISKRSCKRRLCSLKHFYTFLVNQGYAKENPFIFISAPKTDKTYPHSLYDDEVQQIFKDNALRTDELALRDQAIIETLYYTGIRASELVGIKVQDVDLRNREILVFGKEKRERIVPFSEACQKTLQKYIKNCRIALISKTKTPTPFLFLNNRGNPLTVRGLEHILDSIEEKTGNNVGLHPHLLRHSYATHLLENGMDLRYIQDLLGHRNLNATQVYTHVTEKAMKEVYADAFPRAHKK